MKKAASKKLKPKPCRCDRCFMSKHLTAIAAKCSPIEKDVIDWLWTRMESAETNLDWIEAQLKSKNPKKPHDRN